ncbi:SMP-30/gluconolactonase/LRE family protein [Novosphingobium sp.]|uniref:SMP-30/gluconolactonase/LRE family protein n=1 Tax=Novosphingobium sp. TaxID=1874826 RepID=UPI0038BBAD1D
MAKSKADWQILPRDTRDTLGEGITYVVAENALYWVDIIGQRVQRFNLSTGAYAHWAMPEMVGWVLERANGQGFIAGLKSGFHTLTLEPFALSPIAAPEPHLPTNRMNDACVDAKGRIFAGTMSMEGQASGALYRLDPDLTHHHVDAPYTIANGPTIAPDGAWLYHTCSAAGEVYRFALNDDGSLGRRELFVAFPDAWGSPDGMVADAEGGIWIAHWGGSCVSRFTPEGKRERWIDLPASQITKPCFAGENFDRLFVTSAADGVDEPLAGAVFEVDPGCRGLPSHRFGG